MNSYEKINYALRPNKNVERKLILECFNELRLEFDIEAYRYVGLGSIWFSDFILFHKFSGLKNMISIEDSEKKRFEYNSPFSCIKVKLGKTTSILPKLSYNHPTICWLDYDGVLHEYFFVDIEIFCERAKDASFLLVTCNADKRQLKDFDGDGKLIPPHLVLEGIAKDYVPIDAKSRITKNDFPSLLSEIFFNAIKSILLKKRNGFTYRPLFNFSYSDGAPMITIGCCICSEDTAKRYDDLKLNGIAEYFGTDRIFEIDMPTLTVREKGEFDKILPSDAPPDPSDLPFELKPPEIKNYWRFYRYYPVFGEIHP